MRHINQKKTNSLFCADYLYLVKHRVLNKLNCAKYLVPAAVDAGEGWEFNKCPGAKVV